MPDVAPAGTTAFIDVADATVTVVEFTPLNCTVIGPTKFVPVIIIVAPTLPLVGENDVTVGALMYVKLLALVNVPCGVATEIAPVVPPGTVTVI